MSQYSIPPPKEWPMKPTREGSARPENSTPWRSPVSTALYWFIGSYSIV